MGKSLLLPIAVALTVLPSAHGATRLRVTGDKVNLRAGADYETEVVGSVSKQHVLTAGGEVQGDWTKVVPPPHVDLWVHGEMVQDGVVTVSRVRVRSGAGISYRPVGALDRGVRVAVRGRQGDWLRIAPPAGSWLWIYTGYVKPVFPQPAKPKRSPPGPRPRPVTVGQPTGSTVKEVDDEATSQVQEIPTRVPDVLNRSRLLPFREQARMVKYAGTVRPVPFTWRRPGRYRLMADDEGGKLRTACFLVGDRKRLAAMLGEPVTVFGREYWLERMRYPVVVCELITTEGGNRE